MTNVEQDSVTRVWVIVRMRPIKEAADEVFGGAGWFAEELVAERVVALLNRGGDGHYAAREVEVRGVVAAEQMLHVVAYCAPINKVVWRIVVADEGGLWVVQSKDEANAHVDAMNGDDMIAYDEYCTRSALQDGQQKWSNAQMPNAAVPDQFRPLNFDEWMQVKGREYAISVPLRPAANNALPGVFAGAS